jgi:hypothetical protein
MGHSFPKCSFSDKDGLRKRGAICRSMADGMIARFVGIVIEVFGNTLSAVIGLPPDLGIFDLANVPLRVHGNGGTAWHGD